jgi:murein DD-endopeptidase MepM/ murein hydrolase activator NlpD
MRPLSAAVLAAAVLASSGLALHGPALPAASRAAQELTDPQPAGSRPVRYQPPVDGPLIDVFRPPPSPFAAGNRGVDYATAPGTAVRAAADGQVVFAGPVGGRLHVVVRHADGIRTSYSFLATVTVRRGQRVAAGHEVGTAGPSVHFGARRGETYIDPLSLLAGSGSDVHLVPDDVER